MPHRRLLAELAIWIEAEDLLRLIGHWLNGFSSNGRGIAQGAPISPLLANLYLHPLDRLRAAAGLAPVRYADDFVVLAAEADRARQARRIAEGVLAERGLALKPEKTRIVVPRTPFQYLGETLCARGRGFLRLQ
nr:reverse transcriptase/maturase family protein [uncultured Rhodopila sp.]